MAAVAAFNFEERAYFKESLQKSVLEPVFLVRAHLSFVPLQLRNLEMS